MSETSDMDSLIVGLCPKCHDWFLCDAYFDRTAPLPCCDSCRLPPVKLAYVGQASGRTP